MAALKFTCCDEPTLHNQTSATSHQTLTKLQEELCASVRGLSVEQTQLRPQNRSTAWTIQQVVEHLLLTYKGTSLILGERLTKGTPTLKPVTFKQQCMQFAVTSAGYFPTGQAAPLPMRPASDADPRSGEELASLIEKTLAALDALIAECEGVLGRGRSVTHASLGPMSMQQWRRFQLVHGRHHIRQIMGIRAEYGLE